MDLKRHANFYVCSVFFFKDAMAKKSTLYMDGSRAVYRLSLSFRGPQMNMCRLIDEVSVYLQDRSNCHITLLYNVCV